MSAAVRVICTREPSLRKHRPCVYTPPSLLADRLSSPPMATSWLSHGALSESLSEASKRLSAAVAPLHELSVDGMFPAEGGRPAPLPPATPAAAPAAAASSGVFTIGNTDSPTPPAHAAARDVCASARPEGNQSAEGSGSARPSLAELRAAELRASSLQSEVDATKLKALTKIRAQDEQLRQLRAALDGAEAQRRRLESEMQRHKLKSANAAAAASASASASTSSTAQTAPSSSLSAAGFAPASAALASELGRQMQPPPTPLAATHPNAAAAAGLVTPLTRTDGGAA